MIPKIIHFCWLSGDEYPPLVKKCIDTWKKKLPDFEIKMWDASSFDFNSVQFVKEALELKKYAFVSDYIRLYALYTQGGIYLDSDVLVFKRFDDLLKLHFFTGVEYRSGEQEKYFLESAIMGSEPGNKVIQECMKYYESLPFVKPDGSLNTIPAPNVFTPAFTRYYSWTPSPDEVEVDDGVMVFGTDKIRNSEYPTRPNPIFYHCNSQSWIAIEDWRGPLFRYCKTHNLQYEYKVFSTFVMNTIHSIQRFLGINH